MKELLTIIIDDDPTGIQTVQDCLVLTRWDIASLKEAINDRIPFFFIFANTRSMTPGEAKKTVREIATNLKEALAEASRTYTIISRSDSTLRSHFPLELTELEEVLDLKPDYRLLIPAFFEGNRVTIGDSHYIRDQFTLTPCDQTEFARDSVFSYTSSYLPDYIREKYTKNSRPVPFIGSLSLIQLREKNQIRLIEQVESFPSGSLVIINAENYDDLKGVSTLFHHLISMGKTCTMQSAASFVKSFTLCPDQSLLSDFKVEKPGLILAGSHVQKTTEQINRLKEFRDLGLCEIEADRILSDSKDYGAYVLSTIENFLKKGLSVLAYTSRRELKLSCDHERLRAGKKISQFLVNITAHITFPLGFLVSKGGITSNDTLSRGLNLSRVRVLGQIEPGIPVVQIPTDHKFATMPLVIFPGNVGSLDSLVMVYDKLTGRMP